METCHGTPSECVAREMLQEGRRWSCQEWRNLEALWKVIIWLWQQSTGLRDLIAAVLKFRTFLWVIRRNQSLTLALSSWKAFLHSYLSCLCHWHWSASKCSLAEEVWASLYSGLDLDLRVDYPAFRWAYQDNYLFASEWSLGKLMSV